MLPNAISFKARGNCRIALYHLAYKLIIIQMESFRYFYSYGFCVGFDLSIDIILHIQAIATTDLYHLFFFFCEITE